MGWARISLAWPQPEGLEGGNSQAPENQARSHYLWIDVGRLASRWRKNTLDEPWPGGEVDPVDRLAVSATASDNDFAYSLLTTCLAIMFWLMHLPVKHAQSDARFHRKERRTPAFNSSYGYAYARELVYIQSWKKRAFRDVKKTLTMKVNTPEPGKLR